MNAINMLSIEIDGIALCLVLNDIGPLVLAKAHKAYKQKGHK